MFFIEVTKKKINIPKVLRYSWLRIEGFDALLQQLKRQNLMSFLEL